MSSTWARLLVGVTLLSGAAAANDTKQKWVSYQCDKEARQAGLPRSSFPVKYVAGAGKSAAIIPVNKQSVTLTRVAAAQGAKYVAGPLTWWEKGKSGTTVSEDLPTGKVSGSCRAVSTDDLGPIVYPDIP